MCMSEPGAGTDVLGLSTTATEDGDYFMEANLAFESASGFPKGALIKKIKRWEHPFDITLVPIKVGLDNLE